MNPEAARTRGARPLQIYFAAVGAIVALGGGAAAAVLLIAPASSARLLGTGLIAGGIAAALVALLVVYRQVARPIVRLSSAVRGLRGSTGQSVPVAGPAEVAILGEDINELTASLQRSAAEREAAHRSYVDLFDSNPLPILIVDPTNSAILDVNEAAVRSLGYAADELRRMRTPELTVTDTPAQEALLNEIRRSQLPAVRFGPFSYRRKDGSLMRVMGTSYVVLYEQRRIRVVMLEDVTERESAKQSYIDLFEGNPLPTIVVDVRSLDILDANAATERALGYSRDELKTMRTPDLTVAETAEQEEQLRAARKSDAPTLRFGPIAYRRKDGSLMRAVGTSYVVRYGDRRLRVAMLEDVTEKEKIERQMQQAQRLESLGQLAGGVAHDFNNLLTMILNVVGSLRESATSAEATRDIDRIDKAAQSASRLTHQLLAFARREVAPKTAVDVSTELADLRDLLARTIGSHIVLTMDLEREAWPVAIDRGHLEQIVINVSVNARDAMPKGGRLRIATRNVELDASPPAGARQLPPGRYVRVEITDSGTGMDPSTLEHAFEPFFTTKPVGQGTGMGLATVYGIVTQAGGRVGIESELGRGTTVTVLLPATTAEVAKMTPKAPVARTPASGTILVVEDYAELRELFDEILKGAGYKVMTAPDGAAALVMAREHRGRIDVLLTDVVMPNMLGTDLAELLRSEQPELRVVFMSGHAQAVSGTGTSVPPGAPLLQKPFLESELLDRLAEVLSRPPAPGGVLA